MFFKFISYVYIMLLCKPPNKNRNSGFCFFSGVMILTVITAVTIYCVFILLDLKNNTVRQLLFFSLALRKLRLRIRKQLAEVLTSVVRVAHWTTLAPTCMKNILSSRWIILSTHHSGRQRCILFWATWTSSWE